MTFKVLRSNEIFICPLPFVSGSHEKTTQNSISIFCHLELNTCFEMVVLLSFILCPVAPVAYKYFIVHSVCVKCLHETNVQTSWSFEGNNKKGCEERHKAILTQCDDSIVEISIYSKN